MKKVFAIPIFLLLLHTANFAQPAYVNAKYTLGYLATVLTGVYPTDSCVYVRGVMTDSLYRAGAFFSKVGLDGQFIWTKELIDSTKQFESWWPKLIQNPAGNFIIAGVIFDPQITAFVAEYDVLGNLINFKKFNSPYYPDNPHIVITSISVLKQGGYMTTGLLDNNRERSIFLAKLDDSLQLKWIKTYGGNLFEASWSLLVDEDDGILLGGMEYTNLNNLNIICRKTITKLDSTGQQLIWEWKSPMAGLPPVRGWLVRDMLQLPDGSIVGASALSKEKVVNAGSSLLIHSPSVFKLKPDHTLDWETSIGNGVYSDNDHEFIRVVPATDGDGYVTTGSLFVPNYDTTLDVASYLGVIAKVAANGDSLWMRYIYYYTDSTISRYHYMSDLAAAPGGGYWLCGQAVRQSLTEPLQQGWLLRVDEYGCMMPGCQLVSVAPEAALADKIKLYPNPASDHLTIYHGGYAFRQGRFHIIDLQGRIIRAWVAPANDLSTVFDLSGFAPGSFVLQYLEQGKVLAGKQFVVVGKP